MKNEEILFFTLFCSSRLPRNDAPRASILFDSRFSVVIACIKDITLEFTK